MKKNKATEFDGGGTILEEEDILASNLEEGMQGKMMPKFSVLIGRPLKFPDPAALAARIEEYFDFCDPHLEEVDVPTYSKTRGWFIDKQFQQTEQEPYTISGLALFLDTQRTTLLDYEYLLKKKPEDLPAHLRNADPKILASFTNTIKKAKSRVENFVEKKLMGGAHPVGPIFNLKNNFQMWEDKTVVDNKSERELREQVEDLRSDMAERIKANKKKK